MTKSLKTCIATAILLCTCSLYSFETLDSIEFKLANDRITELTHVDPDSALFIGLDLIPQLQKIEGFEEETALIYQKIAIIYDQKTNFKESLCYLDSASYLAEQYSLFSLSPKLINSKGVVHLRTGNYEKALENFLESLSLAQAQQDTITSISALSNAGHVAYYHLSPEEALKYYQKATTLAWSFGNQQKIANALSNEAFAHQVMENYSQSVAINLQALQILESYSNDPSWERANIHQNLGLIEKKQGNNSKAIFHLSESLKDYDQLGSKDGMAQTYVNISDIYRMENKNQEAISILKKALNISHEIGLKEGIKHAHDNLAVTYEAMGKHDSALVHLKKYHAISDSLMNATLGAQLSEMRTKFETAEKDKEIALLESETASDKATILEQEMTIERSRIWIIGGIIFLMMAGAILYITRSNRKLLLQKSLQKKFAQKLIDWQEYERKRLAQELHDGIGQNLVLLKNRIHSMFIGKQDADQVVNLEKSISDTIQEVRGISYSLRPFQLDLSGLEGAIEELIRDVEISTGINIESTVNDIDEKLEPDKEIHIFRIFQEAFQNIIKHSGASNITLQAITRNDKLLLNIKDDGKGFKTDNIFKTQKLTKGLGMRGMKERVLLLGGDFLVESKEGSGTNINISIPLLS